MKLFFYDFETTGLDTERCAPYQLSGLICVDGKVVDKFNYQMKPFEGALIEESAFRITKIKPEDIMKYEDGEVAYKDLCRKLMKFVYPNTNNENEKFVTVGYNNSKFDDDLLFAFFRRYSHIPVTEGYKRGFYKGSFFNKYLTIDVMQLAKAIVGPYVPDIENFKLGTVTKYLNAIDEETLAREEFHDAKFDILATFNLFKLLYKYIIPFKKPGNATEK